MFGSGDVLAKAGALDPAVVCHVDHNRVLSQVLFVEIIEQLTTRFIKPLTHSPVFGNEQRVGFIFVFVQ